MDFLYDDEQDALREATRGLVGKAYSDYENRRQAVRDDPGFDEKQWAKMAEMDLLGLPFSEDDGGVGAGPVEIGIVCQELGRVLAPEPYLASVVHAGGLVAAVGTVEQGADLLGRLSAGDILLAAADTSPGDRWTARADGVRASRDGDAWTLAGVADPVVGGESADHFVVTATLPGGAGTGVFTRALAALVGAGGEVIAVDRDAGALEAIRAWSARATNAPAVTVIHADIARDLSLPRLDGAVLANVLHFVLNATGVLSRVASALELGGRVVVIEYEGRRPSRWVPYPVSAARLEELAADAGLAPPRVVATRPSAYGGDLYVAVTSRMET